MPHVPFSEVMPGVDPELAKIIDRSLAKDKSARYRACEEMSNDLTRFLSRLGTLEADLAAELSRTGVLSKTIAADSIEIASELESVRFRPIDPLTDYGLNLQRYRDRKAVVEPIPAPAAGDKKGPRYVASSRRKLMLAAVAIPAATLIAVVGYYIPGASDSSPGSLQLQVEPWAEVESIAQVPGGKQFLPENLPDKRTPLSITLPGGTYTVRVAHPQLGGFEFPVEIAPGKANRVVKAFPGFLPGDRPGQ
jgi:hypothetical protein